MKKFIFIILFFASTQAFACELPAGEYRLITESEWSVYLEILNDKDFVVSWGAYVSGQPNSLETKSYTGIWSCKDDTFIFKYELETAEATYSKSDDYPLGIYKDKKAIIFSGEQGNNKFLSGYKFWPVSE